MNDLPDWLQEMIDIQAYGIPHLLSAPITKCFPCVAYNNHINETDPRGWSRTFLRKSGAFAWEVFDKHFEKIGPDMEWDGNDGLRNMWDWYYRCPDPAYIQSLQATRNATIRLSLTIASCKATNAPLDRMPNDGLVRGAPIATDIRCNPDFQRGDDSADISQRTISSCRPPNRDARSIFRWY